MTVGRWALALAAVSVVGLIGIGIASELDDSAQAGPYPDDVYEQLVQLADEYEDGYMTYGRWHDLLVATAFAGLLVASPFVRGAARAKHVLVGGAAIAVVGDMIDLSQMIGIDEARWAATADLPMNFVAANTFRFSINQTSTYVWVAGLFLVAIGLVIVTRDAHRRSVAIGSGAFALVLAVTGLTDLFGSGQQLEVAMWALGAAALAWIVVAWNNLDDARHAVQLEAR